MSGYPGGWSLFVRQVCAMPQADDGLALMPTAWAGTTWEFRPKDYATRRLSLFDDGDFT